MDECHPPEEEDGRGPHPCRSVYSLDGGTHNVGYEARSHNLAPSVVRPLAAASVASLTGRPAT
jgi:hypothetical protein